MSTENEKHQSPIVKERPLLAFGFGALTVLLIFFLVFKAAGSGIDPSQIDVSFKDIVYEQIIFSVMVLLLPSFILSRNFMRSTKDYFRIKKKPPLIPMVLFLVLFFTSNFFLHWMVNLMELIPLKGYVGTTFKNLQESTMAIQETLLIIDGPLEFVAIFILMAVLPAFCEEIFFRGLLQGSLQKAGLAFPHPIIISALLFALIHVQLTNMLALFFMGLLLGYAYYRTKNIWVPIIAHLFNNGLIVSLSYLHQKQLVNFDIEAEPPFLLAAGALVLFLVILYLFNTKTNHLNKA